MINIKLSGYQSYVSGLDSSLLEEPGQQHYRLLAYFSTLFDHHDIFDIGTHLGYSAYALAYNQNNVVHSFDVIEKPVCEQIKHRSNIVFHHYNLMTLLDNDPWMSKLLSSPLIFLDIDPHDGQTEFSFYNFLKKHHYQGILICDDIWYFKGMRDHFWYQIPPNSKYDLTFYGHWSGTGLIHFQDQAEQFPYPYRQILPPKVSNDDWTLVTAYFDLHNYCDASPELRSTAYYMEHAQSVMCCPYNLVVYCDQYSLPFISRLRPTFLADKTRYIILDFDQLKFEGHPGYQDLTFKDYRQRILQNRKTHPYHFDPRNNASYYLFCMSRSVLLKKTIEINPFHSNYFAWINICIERMGYKNLVYLDQTLSLHRQKFSTLFINYLPPTILNDLATYFFYGRCSMCSGFYTGQLKYIKEVSHQLEEHFLIYLEQGYGHADEQLFLPVYFKYPHLFEHYYGEYSDMITNYCHVRDNANKILSIFINRSFAFSAYQQCYQACLFLWNSYLLGQCSLTDQELKQLMYYKSMSQKLQQKSDVPIIPLTGNPEKMESNSSGIDNGNGSVRPNRVSTIITLLYDMGSEQNERVQKIIDLAHQWTKLTFPIIVWTDDKYYSYLSNLFNNNQNVRIIKRSWKDFETMKWYSTIEQLYHKYQVYNRNPIKDTVDYHMLMYTRPLMWKQSIIENPFNTQTFICIDFGITRFTTDLHIIETWKIPNKIKMLLINPYLKSDPDPEIYFTMTHHNVAGGLITGQQDNLLHLIDLFESELNQMINDQWCQLDEALWASIIRKNPELFEFYYGDYCGIIDNYTKLINMTNVPNIIQKYLNNGLYLEAQKVIDLIDYHHSPLCTDVFINFSILANYYTKNKQLDPAVYYMLQNPKNAMYLQYHANNLKFYNFQLLS